MSALGRYTDLVELRARVRSRADMVNSNFVTDTEIDYFIQGSWGELYDLIIENYGMGVFEENYSFSTTSGTQSYPLDGIQGGLTGSQSSYPPEVSDVYKIISVSISLSGSKFYQIRQAQPHHVRAAADLSSWAGVSGVRYKVQIVPNNRYMRKYISFFPIPSGVHSVSIQYIPCAPHIIENPEADTLGNLSTGDYYGYTTPILYADWGEYVVVDAAAKALEKEESDSSPLLRRKAELADRIKWHAQNLILDEAGSVRDFEAEAEAYSEWYR